MGALYLQKSTNKQAYQYLKLWAGKIVVFFTIRVLFAHTSFEQCDICTGSQASFPDQGLCTLPQGSEAGKYARGHRLKPNDFNQWGKDFTWFTPQACNDTRIFLYSAKNEYDEHSNEKHVHYTRFLQPVEVSWSACARLCLLCTITLFPIP